MPEDGSGRLIDRRATVASTDLTASGARRPCAAGELNDRIGDSRRCRGALATPVGLRRGHNPSGGLIIGKLWEFFEETAWERFRRVSGWSQSLAPLGIARCIRRATSLCGRSRRDPGGLMRGPSEPSFSSGAPQPRRCHVRGLSSVTCETVRCANTLCAPATSGTVGPQIAGGACDGR